MWNPVLARSRRLRAATAWLALASFGCKPVGNGECEGVGREVTLDEVLPRGPTLREALALLGEQQVTAIWADDTPTGLSLSLARDQGPAEWVEFHQGSTMVPFFVAEPEMAILCPQPSLYIPVRLALHSDDGRVAIDEPTEARAFRTVLDSAGRTEPALAIDLSERAGKLDGMPDPEEWTDPRFQPDRALLDVLLTGSRTEGSLGWSGETRLPAWKTKERSREYALLWDTELLP